MPSGNPGKQVPSLTAVGSQFGNNPDLAHLFEEATVAEAGTFDPNDVTKLIITPDGTGAWGNIQFTSIPELTTALMMMAGLFGLGIAGRRR